MISPFSMPEEEAMGDSLGRERRKKTLRKDVFKFTDEVTTSVRDSLLKHACSSVALDKDDGIDRRSKKRSSDSFSFGFRFGVLFQSVPLSSIRCLYRRGVSIVVESDTGGASSASTKRRKERRKNRKVFDPVVIDNWHVLVMHGYQETSLAVSSSRGPREGCLRQRALRVTHGPSWSSLTCCRRAVVFNFLGSALGSPSSLPSSPLFSWPLGGSAAAVAWQ